MRPLVALAVLSVLLTPWPALGQDRPAAVVSVSGGVQPGTNRLSESIQLTKYFESTPIAAELSTTAVPFFDAGVELRVFRRLGAQVAVSMVSNRDDAAVTGGIPHPFYFNRSRSVSGQVAVARRELAVHLGGTYLIGSPGLYLLLFGGASFFSVEQDVVTDVLYDESYPFDAATFTSAKVAQVKVSETGYNVGTDVTWRLSPRWGIGGLVRFSRASVPLVADGVDAGTTDVGGLMVGVGLRLMF